MKKALPFTLGFTLLLWLLVPTLASAQLKLHGQHAGFGIDGDIRPGYLKMPGGQFAATVDDWFPMNGRPGVMDTTGTAAMKADLQAGKNVLFHRNMSVAPFTLVNNRMWIDAAYARDFSSNNGPDATVYDGGAKNGMSPLEWGGRQSQIPSKTDILDGFVHFRRAGKKIKDSLWMMTGLSTQTVEGERHLDVELFKNRVVYDETTGRFGTDALHEGRTEWVFDAKGNVIRTGDLIVAVSYMPGQPPKMDIRIWVSRLTYATRKPSRFKFAGPIEGGNLYGFASILPINSAEVLGSGSANFSNYEVVADSTTAAPWGTTDTRGNWSANFDQLQFMEFALNLTALGLDPAAYKDVNACDYNFQTVFFKSRSSNSFTSQLKDFVGPIYFRIPMPKYEVNQTFLINCLNPVKQLSAVNRVSNAGTYNWYTPNGRLKSASADSSTVEVADGGTYILTSRLAEGCAAYSVETFRVEADKVAPVVSADITLTNDGQIQLLAVDNNLLSQATSLLLPPTPVTWQWKGPNGFISNEQNPVINSDWLYGAYYLTATNTRNGCQAIATLDMSFKTRKVLAEAEAVAKLKPSFFLVNEGGRLYLNCTVAEAGQYQVAAVSVDGRMLHHRPVQLVAGQQRIALPLPAARQLRVITLTTAGKTVFSGKVFF